MTGRRALVVFLLALYAVSFAVREHATKERVSAGHGDVSGYYHVAVNLATGRGFVQDFVAEYLQDPRAIPAPSNSWWQPLPSIVAAIGMKVQGDTSYVAAKHAMIAVSALLPLLVFFTGWFLLRSRVAGAAAAILAVGFHLYLDQPCQTLTHGLYGLLAGACLLIVMAWRERPRLLPWFGLVFGLAYLTRGDGQVLVAGLAATVLARRFRFARERLPWKSLAVAAALFVVVVAPWWVRNLRVFGEAMPSGKNRIAWARHFEDWFVSDASRLTFESYRKWGTGNILAQKTRGLTDALEYAPFCFYRAVTREQESDEGDVDRAIFVLGKWVMTPLLFLGLAVLALDRRLKRRAAVASAVLHVLLLALLYGVAFPAVGRESFRSSLFSVFPVFLVAVIAGIAFLLSTLRERSPRAHGCLLLCAALALSVANVVVATPHLDDKHRGKERMLAPYRAFGRWAAHHGIADQIFFVRNPWEFTVETGIRSAMIPSDGIRGLSDRAKLYGARYVLDETSGGHSLGEWRPAMRALIERRSLKPEFVDDPPPRFTIYRFDPE